MLDPDDSSPYFTAPEVFDDVVDPKSDVWSLGAILYMMLCGQPPFAGKNSREVMREVASGQVDTANA